MFDLYGRMQIIYYEDIRAAARNNFCVFGTKEEAEQFKCTLPLISLKWGRSIC